MEMHVSCAQMSYSDEGTIAHWLGAQRIELINLDFIPALQQVNSVGKFLHSLDQDPLDLPHWADGRI